MLPQIKPNRTSCLVTACSMVLDMEQDVLFKAIGHDGMKVVFDDAIPHCYAGFNIQEITDALIKLGYATVLIIRHPANDSRKGESYEYLTLQEKEARFLAYMRAYSCVLLIDNPGHAIGSYYGMYGYEPDTGLQLSQAAYESYTARAWGLLLLLDIRG